MAPTDYRMKKILKFFAVAVIAVLLTPILILAGYITFVCAPKLDDIFLKIEQSSYENKNTSEVTRSLINASTDGGYFLKGHVAGQLMNEYRRGNNGVVPHRHFQWVGWYAFSELFFDEDDTFTLFSTLVYNGSGHGLNELAMRIFYKPLSELTAEQTAEVVAVTRAPSYFLGKRERLESVRDMLIERAQLNAP